MTEQYLFTSARLGFRAWRPTDILPMAAINADIEVMEFFPRTNTLTQTEEFIERMELQLADKGYCYYAVDVMSTGLFIGFIGLCYQTYEAPFTPCTDIGWRLQRQAWGRGYATEGAQRCMDYGLNDLRLKEIYAIAPKINTRSVQVMNKIGMQKAGEFQHPLLANDERLRECVLYKTSIEGYSLTDFIATR